jgi:hypothetical protein
MWGQSQCKRGSPDLLEFAAWRRHIFVRVAVMILYLFTTVNEFAVFFIRIAATRIKLCLCRYFTVAKNPQDYSSKAVQQLQSAGRCEQGAVR